MKAPTPSTEARIRAAARQVFMRKGYAGTTSRDLAEATGLNVALVNYYFRSKANLFQLTFADFHRQFFGTMGELMQRDIPLREKVQLMIEAEFELVEANPDLPLFVLAELARNPDLFPDLRAPAPPPLFLAQVAEAIASGQLPPMHPMQLMMLILANVQHPYMARTALTKTLHLSDAAFAKLMHQHKQTVKQMLLGYLFGPAAPGTEQA